MADQPQPISTTSSTVHLATHSPEFAKQVIFTDDIIEFVRHYLLNETINETGTQWIRRKIKQLDGSETELRPLMKEEYVYQLTSMLRPTITRIMILTKMELEEVNNMILITANDLDYWFAMSWKKAGIEKELYFSDLISDSLINLIQALAKMSQEGSIQKFFGETYKTTESLMPQPMQQRSLVSLPSSFTSALLPGGSSK
jgi:hypothetical protein